MFPRWRRKRKAAEPPSDPDEWLGLSVSVLGEGDSERLAAEREQARATLHRVVAEAVIWQDEAEELLQAIRAREPLADVVPRGRRLKERFLTLRAELPEVRDGRLRRQIATVRSVLDHHAQLLARALDLLRVDRRPGRGASAAIAEELDAITGLGEPADWLDAVRDELVADEVAS